MTGEIPTADALTAAGWRPGRDAAQDALHAILRTVTVGRWEVFPAAERALREFHGLRVPAVGDGLDVAATGCLVDPQEARYAGPPLRQLGHSLGTRLFPFGRTDSDAPMAVDEDGRLFTLGVGGGWLLGDSAHDGLLALAVGRRPVRLRSRERYWPLSGMPADLAAGVRAALVAVYVLHHTGVYSARALRLQVTTLRGVGVLALDRTFPLLPGPLEASAEPLTRSMEEALAAAGLRAQNCELALAVPAPSGTPGPLAELDCTVTVGGPAGGPTLSLSAGMSASYGRASRVLAACEAAFAAWATPH
ncbi:SUKH-3 domain-containing protein [Streptomyces antimicrobicus]|uniref:SUKH-3 domain-containing protein n=1 Tax=Streptomyces antimicrobicus TaxID=2883108 RepID=A0ABS8B4Y3_9ACTN|nr:SUKH-3 domain-containing protein [Streptomyces antimicrobicus]MCB5179670.1 SUKH-3 domain-containing protein [Streptomyces antimicrobicus]